MALAGYVARMALKICSDLTPAVWIQDGEIPWEQLATFGPSGFAAYARLRFLRDPAFAQERASDAGQTETRDGREQWPALAARLAGHTRTPTDCYFCLWEGWPVARLGHVGTLMSSPRVTIPAGAAVPARAYFLFHGPLSQIGEWDVPWRDTAGRFGLEPAFIWPVDHAWCVASDVDPHWAGVGGDRSLIDELLADPRLDIARADPAVDQPTYER